MSENIISKWSQLTYDDAEWFHNINSLILSVYIAQYKSINRIQL